MGRHTGKVYLSSDESSLVSMPKGACKDVCVWGWWCGVGDHLGLGRVDTRCRYCLALGDDVELLWPRPPFIAGTHRVSVS
jgi:hypothetical protein